MTKKAKAKTHDEWFRAKVQEALADTSPTVPHKKVMEEVRAVIDRKRPARA